MDPRNRRTVLKLVGLGMGCAGTGSAVGLEQETGFTAGLERDEQPTYAVVQGDGCVPVTPISGPEPVEAFYDWAPTPEKRWSSNGTTHLQRADTSIVFLYDGPDATSLVVVHGELGGDGTGGSASFAIDGLPPDGEWVVEDDNYDGPNNYDSWYHVETASKIDWTWAGGRTDGGAFRGVTTEDTIRIVPRFNEMAALYGRYYEGTVDRWEFLSAGADGPKRIDLAKSVPLVVGGMDCPGDGETLGDSDDGDDGDDEQDRKNQRKQAKHEKKQRKHERKQDKHAAKERKKHERKQAKHEKKQRKHELKREKHETKERVKHRKKQLKHEKKQRKHELKREKHAEKEDDD